MAAQPPASITAGSPFGLTIQFVNRDGSLDTNSIGRVTVTLGSNPGGAVLGGTLTVTASQGVATFTDLTLYTAAAEYTLRVTTDGLTAATTIAFDVTPGVPARLVISTPPPGSGAFGLMVTIEDGFGNVETGFNGSVMIVTRSGSGKDTRRVTLAVTASQGIATFSRLKLNKKGHGHALQATAAGLTAATTGRFDVTLAAAVKSLTVQARLIRVQTKPADHPAKHAAHHTATLR